MAARWGWAASFTEIVPRRRVQHTERFDEAWYAGESLNTWVLTEKDGRTTLTLTMRYETRETRDQVLDSGMESGVAVSYERLDKILPGISAQVAK